VSKHPHKETIVIIAKTYPELSEKYGCLVCTVGINEDGEWRRIFPIPWYFFMRPGKEKRLNFKKWDIVSLTLQKAQHDPRKESYRVIEPEKLQILGSIKDWNERRQLVQKYLDPDMKTLREEKRSLGLIKPKTIEDFLEKRRERIKDEGEKAVLDRLIPTLLPEFELPVKPWWENLRPTEIPWMGYQFTCQGKECKGHSMMCVDWEIQELYRKEGFQKTKQKALFWMKERDLYFCVGTTWKFPTWMIISLIYPPKMLEQPLIEYLTKEPEPLMERKCRVKGQLRFTSEGGLEGQTTID
jgi:hypothetical protein